MKSVEHIVFVSPGFAKNESDDTCIPPFQAYLLALVKSHATVEVEVIALHYPPRKGNYYWNGIKVHSLHGDQWGSFWKNYNVVPCAPTIEKIHRKKHIDLVHSFWVNDATFTSQRFCKKRHIPLLATIMGQDALSSNVYLKYIDFEYIRTVALSCRAAEKFENNTQKQVSAIIPWGIDPVIANKTVHTGQKDFDIIAVGSLIAIKDYESFLYIIHTLAKRKNGVKAVVFVQGPLYTEIEKNIRQLGLENHIVLRGRESRANVLHTMERSKVLLHTAHYEGQGYVFLEALANGLPVVCRDVGFLPQDELVHICNNREEMIDSVLSILTNPGTGRKAIPLDIQDTVNEYWKIYHQETQKTK